MPRVAPITVLLALAVSGAALAQTGRPAPPDQEVTETGRATAWPRLPVTRAMASSGAYRPEDWIVAHPTLPLGLRLLLTDERGERAVVVTVADHGSDLESGAMLVSEAVARRLGIDEDDVERVRFRRLRPGDPADPGVWSPGAQGSGAVRRWSVQLGSFGERRWAERFAERLDGARIERLRVEGNTVYRVYFGRFADRADAEAWRDRLAGWGIDGFVKDLDGER